MRLLSYGPTSIDDRLMHICAIAAGLPTRRNPSLGIFFVRLLEALRDAGHEITLISPVRRWLPQKIRVDLPGIEVHHPRYVPYGALSRVGIAGRRWAVESSADASVEAFERLSRRPDAILAHFLVPPGLAAARISERHGIPAFCSLGESYHPTWFGEWGRDEITRLLSAFTALFPVSQAIGDFLIAECGIAPGRVHVVRNGVVATLFNRDAAARREDSRGRRMKVALFVGSAEPRKGAYLLREAARRLESWELWIVGPGHPRSFARNVRLFGPVDQAELPAFYRAADVFVLPSSAEGMPNALLEAVACGVPAAVSRIPPIVELLGPDYPYYCDLDPASVADAVRRAAAAARGTLYPPGVPWSVAERAEAIARHIARYCSGTVADSEAA